MHRQRINLNVAAPHGYRALVAAEDALRKEGLVDSRLRELLKIRTSQLNGSAYSLDRHTEEALRLGESPQRLNQLAGWRESALITPTERAALALAEAITRLAPEGVPEKVYDEAEHVLGPRNLAHVIMTVALANALDRLSVTARLQPPDAR